MVRAIIKFAFDFFLFSSLFISGCAVVMVHQTVHLLRLPDPPQDLYSFVFWATMASYNFHWYLTPAAYSSSERTDWSRKHKNLELGLCAMSALCAAYYIFFLHAYAAWILIGVFLTFLYTAPKIPFKPFALLQRIAIGKTLFLTGVWTYITTVLPVAVTGAHYGIPGLLLTLHRFLLIYAICILFDYRDREQDKKEGIRSLVTGLDETGIDHLFYWVCAGGLVCTGALLFFQYAAGVILALVLPILITMFLYPNAKRSRSDYLYYFVLDGLMAFSACFTFFL